MVKLYHEHHDCIPSTHSYVLSNLEALAKHYYAGYEKTPILITSDNQPAGFGRAHGNERSQWISQPNNIFASALVAVSSQSFKKLHAIPMIVSAVLLETILVTFPEVDGRLQFKFPNDLYLDGKKIAGVLTELPRDERGQHFVIVNGRTTDSHTHLERWSIQALIQSLEDRLCPIKYLVLVSFGVNIYEDLSGDLEKFQAGTIGLKRTPGNLSLNQSIPAKVVTTLASLTDASLTKYGALILDNLLVPPDGVLVADTEGGRASRRLTASSIRNFDLGKGQIITDLDETVYPAHD